MPNQRLHVPGAMRWTCNTCMEETGADVGEWWSSQDAAQAAAVWHAYNKHRPQFVAAAGEDRAPKDPLPEMLGRQLAPWEVSE